MTDTRPTLDADALLDRVRAVLTSEGCDIPEEAVRAAVTAHVNPPSLPAVSTGDVPFDFGWKRPVDKREVEARWRRHAWLAWPERGGDWLWRRSPSAWGAMGAGVVGGVMVLVMFMSPARLESMLSDGLRWLVYGAPWCLFGRICDNGNAGMK